MHALPGWLEETFRTLATEGVEAAEKVIERALVGASIAERVDVATGWVEILVAEGRNHEAVALLRGILPKASTLSLRGQLWWRLAMLLAVEGDADGTAKAVAETHRLGALNEAKSIRAAAAAVASLDAHQDNPGVRQAHAMLLGSAARAPTPRTPTETLQLAWQVASAVGEAARGRGERELEAWSAGLLSIISAAQGEHNGAILLAQHAADAAVDAKSPLAYSEAIRNLARSTLLRDGEDAGLAALQAGQERWTRHFQDAGPSPIAAWIEAATRMHREAPES